MHTGGGELRTLAPLCAHGHRADCDSGLRCQRATGRVSGPKLFLARGIGQIGPVGRMGQNDFTFEISNFKKGALGIFDFRFYDRALIAGLSPRYWEKEIEGARLWRLACRVRKGNRWLWDPRRMRGTSPHP